MADWKDCFEIAKERLGYDGYLEEPEYRRACSLTKKIMEDFGGEHTYPPLREFEIYVDTREKKPLWEEYPKLKLDVGDYTTDILHGYFHVERKSAMDLYASLTSQHERFRKELIRAKKRNITLTVFVECLEDEFYDVNFAPPGVNLKVRGSTLKKIVHVIEKNYGIHFVWCDGRSEMRDRIFYWFIHLNYALEKILEVK